VGIDNRLTADQLASLTAGDSVTIESGADFGRKRYRSGRVVRIDPFDIMVNAPGPKGGSFIERYSRRTVSASVVSVELSSSPPTARSPRSPRHDAVPATLTSCTGSGRGTGLTLTASAGSTLPSGSTSMTQAATPQ
jgi:hypothetical protein